MGLGRLVKAVTHPVQTVKATVKSVISNPLGSVGAVVRGTVNVATLGMASVIKPGGTSIDTKLKKYDTYTGLATVAIAGGALVATAAGVGQAALAPAQTSMGEIAAEGGVDMIGPYTENAYDPFMGDVPSAYSSGAVVPVGAPSSGTSLWDNPLLSKAMNAVKNAIGTNLKPGAKSSTSGNPTAQAGMLSSISPVVLVGMIGAAVIGLFYLKRR